MKRIITIVSLVSIAGICNVEASFRRTLVKFEQKFAPLFGIKFNQETFEKPAQAVTAIVAARADLKAKQEAFNTVMTEANKQKVFEFSALKVTNINQTTSEDLQKNVDDNRNAAYEAMNNQNSLMRLNLLAIQAAKSLCAASKPLVTNAEDAYSKAQENFVSEVNDYNKGVFAEYTKFLDDLQNGKDLPAGILAEKSSAESKK